MMSAVPDDADMTPLLSRLLLRYPDDMRIKGAIEHCGTNVLITPETNGTFMSELSTKLQLLKHSSVWPCKLCFQATTWQC